ncbi:MAG: endonuclease/exonuclease/phosphatase family protein [Acidimicrobiia bacterium]
MPELTVAVFNLHWGVDMRGHPYDALSTCLALDADVLVLPEAYRPHGRVALVDELVERTGATLHEVALLSDRHPARPRHLYPEPGTPGICGLAVLSRLPVKSFTDLRLPKAPGDVIERRFAVVAEVLVGDRAVAIGGIHASHRLWNSLPQLRVLDRELVGRGLPSAIAGDCNMWGPPIGAVLRHRERAVRGRTWPASRPHSQIDHIWIDAGFEAIEGSVGPRTGSDHRPVRARLRLR